jgi:uncharacterized protein YbaR (Trm112 family)
VFVELIELLRCPRPHEESPLVASALRSEARHIVEGMLGCPVCLAEFPIAGGVAQFGEAEQAAPDVAPDAATAMRLAAFLELTDARGFALLCGGWGAQIELIRRVSDTPLVLVNPPAVVPAGAAGIIRVRDSVPFAREVARGLALHAQASDAFVATAVVAVRSGGRIVAPALLPLPAGVTELARDDQMWVGEKTATPNPASRPVEIRRGSR